MNIRVYPTPEATCTAAAWQWIAAALDPAPGLVGVSTGTTTTPIHAAIARLYAELPFDTSRLCIAAVDDYIGIPDGHIASCGERVRRQLVLPLGLEERQALLPGRFGGDADAFEAAIAQHGGLKMQMLGLGDDGHIGFNYPGTPLNARTHQVALPQTTKDTLHRLYALPMAEMPEYGLTLGILTIMQSAKVIVVATGEKKARAVRDALKGPVTDRMPASVLQLHRDALWLLDREAAGLL